MIDGAMVADNALADISRDAACWALEAAQAEGASGTMAVRVLLLAAAELAHDTPIHGRCIPISTMLMQAMVEALEAFDNPPPPLAA